MSTALSAPDVASRSPNLCRQERAGIVCCVKLEITRLQLSTTAATAAHYKPNANNPRPAHTAITCRPSDVNVIGGAQVSPPSPTYNISFPVAASSANNEAPEAPKTSPPAVASRPPKPPNLFPSVGRYSHCLTPVAASKPRTTLVIGPTIDPPLPANIPFSPRVT